MNLFCNLFPAFLKFSISSNLFTTKNIFPFPLRLAQEILFQISKMKRRIDNKHDNIDVLLLIEREVVLNRSVFRPGESINDTH